MLKRYLMSVVSIVAITAISAHADPKDDIQAAVQKLSDAGNYSWTTTTKTQGGRYTPGPVDGKTQKDGLSEISGKMMDSQYDMLLKGDKVLVKMNDSGWETPDEAAAKDDQNGGGPSPARFMGFMSRMFRTPVDQAKDNLGNLQNIQKTDDGYTADLTTDAAKAMLSFRRRPTTNPDGDNGNMPQIDVSNAKGTVTISLQDGNLTKIEFHVSGSVSRDGGDPRDVDRTMTTQFKDVGSTSITVPDDAKAKLGS